MNRFPTAGPTIIHCSAGVGRTGTFVGVDKLIQDFEKEASVDIFGLVYQMRMARCLMVQTEAQYICLHEVIYEMQRGKYNLGDPPEEKINDEIDQMVPSIEQDYQSPQTTAIQEVSDLSLSKPVGILSTRFLDGPCKRSARIKLQFEWLVLIRLKN